MTQGLCCCISKLLLVDYKSLSDYGAIWISPVTVCCVGTGGNTCFHYEAWPHSGWGEIRPSGLTSCWYPQGAWIYADINRSICFFVSELIRHQLWWLSEPQLVGNGHRVTLENFKCSLWPSSHPPVQEFAENLLNSGVHGAVMVLDPSFNTESMATALGIQSGKHMVRRHLVEEMKALIGSARWEETITYRDTRRDPTACRSDSLKGQFSQKSKIYIFSLTCDAIHPFRLFLWWRLLKIIHRPCFGTVLSTNTPSSGYKVNYLAYLSKTYTKQSRYIGSTTGKRKKHAYFYILGWTVPLTSSTHLPCRADTKQDNECIGQGTPPTLLRQNSVGRPPSSTGRHTDDEGSLRRRAVKVGKKLPCWKLTWVISLDLGL